jgi:hypothetical protein
MRVLTSPRTFGRPPPADSPTWLDGEPTFKWVNIPNSTLAGSPAGIGQSPGDDTALVCRLTSFSGIAVRDDRIVLAATGGHNDSSDNGFRSIGLRTANPAWVLHKASDWNGTESEVQFYASGSPASAHMHRNVHWVPQRNRMMRMGQRASWGGSAPTFLNATGFNMDTNAWDAAGTHANVVATISVYNPVTRKGYGCTGSEDIYVWDEATDTHALTMDLGTYIPTWAYDTARGNVFGLCWGDGEAGGSGIRARRLNAAGTSADTITLTGAGATAFSTAAPDYGTMVYGADLDCFWWWDGNSKQLFKIVPDGSTSWACTVQTITGTPPVNRSYAFSRMEYVPDMNGGAGLAFLASAAYPMQFVRTS